MQSQKEAVFSAIQSHFAATGRELSGSVELSRDDRAAVTEIVISGINAGNVAFSDSAREKYDTSEKLRAYVSGMVGNWLTKDIRLNGGSKYTPANPGSRAGQGDETIRNLRALRGTLTDAKDIASVDAEIEKRRGELKTSKTKAVPVDMSVIPSELKNRLNLNS